uniref:hypothetical protein n=1 Tax=Gluconobacter thailandicus TaxID=257438 RepID=UPI000ACDE17F|nr:hypothetical protein [Gluconobacter thailandicus]
MILTALSYAAAFVVGVLFFAGCVGACLVAVGEVRTYGKVALILSAIVSASCVLVVRHA